MGGHRHPVQLFHCLIACRSKCGRHDIPALESAEDPWDGHEAVLLDHAQQQIALAEGRILQDRGGGFWDVEEQELPVHQIQMPILA